MIKAEEFKKKLKAAGFNQAQVEAALGYKKSWLSKIIHGKRDMNCEDLRKICELTGIPPQELLGFSMPEPRPERSEEKISKELEEFLPDSVLDRINELRRARKEKDLNTQV